MAYYTAADWLNFDCKIRRSIKLSPSVLEPGGESLCAVQLLKQPLVGKMKSDFSDVMLINVSERDYVIAGDEYIPYFTGGVVPFYVVDDGTCFWFIFELDKKITSASEDEYYLYYAGRSQTFSFEVTSPVLDKENLVFTDTGQTSDQTETRWTFKKPTVSWHENRSLQPSATAMFEFIGHKADFYFKTGPNEGILEYTINESEPIQVDCYAAQDGESKLIAIDTGIVQTNKIRFNALGQKNPGSSSSSIQFTKVKYHQILVGELKTEEVFALVGKQYSVGA